jgi:hypothetical protein
MTFMRMPNGAPFLRLHYSAQKSLTQDKIAALRAKYSTDAYWRREMEIEADALSGQRVWPEFQPHTHVIPHKEIPRKLCRYMAIDPHPRTPHALLWVGIDPWDDWYIYREIWPSKLYGKPGRLRDDDQENEFTTKEYAEAIALYEGNRLTWYDEHTADEYAEYDEMRGGERIITRYMDQAGKGFKVSAEGQELETYATRYRKYGIACADPKKSHEAGEDAVRKLLKVRRHEIRGDWPQLHVSDQCPETILEIQNLRYQITKTPSEEKDLKQSRSEFRSHFCDGLRYLATAPLRFEHSMAS